MGYFSLSQWGGVRQMYAIPVRLSVVSMLWGSVMSLN